MHAGLMAIPALIRGMVGNSYSDGLCVPREPGTPPKYYGMMLERRRKAKRHKPKRTGRRRK